MVSVDECWQYATPVSLERFSQLSLNGRKSRTVRMNPIFWWPFGIEGRRQRLVVKPRSYFEKYWAEVRTGKRSVLGAMLKVIKKRELVSMDFFRGVEEMAFAIQGDRRCLLPPDFVLHVVEITLAMQEAGKTSSTYTLTTSFEPLSPMQTTLSAPVNYAQTRTGLLTRFINKLLFRLHKQ
jgi:hypothetical protein